MSERDRYPSEAAERFQVRLPAGLRDRIKAYAEAHGRSMNTEIVRVLEQHFPEPEPISSRLERLIEMVGSLKEAVDDTNVDALNDAVKDTIARMVKGTIPGLPEKARKELNDRLLAWDIEDGENAYHRFTEGMDEEELDALGGASDIRRW